LPVSPSKFDITVQENTLLVTGKAHKEEEKKNGNGYLHRGIARRAFERRFSLADHMKVHSQPLVRPAVPIRRAETRAV
jgi:molecular chaperone IbpA